MRPAAEALAQTVDVMLERRGQAGDERLALELESRIIVSLFPISTALAAKVSRLITSLRLHLLYTSAPQS